VEAFEARLEQRPLFGRKVMVTRARAQASVLADGLRDLGATVFEFPTIRIDFTPTVDLTTSVTELTKGAYDWLILTSVNGVDAVFNELFRQKSDARGIRSRIAAIGSATEAHLRSRGVVPDLVPPEYVAESIVESLKTQGAVTGKRFLLTRADIARSELPSALKELGGEVRDVVAYHTRLETNGQEAALQALLADHIDAISFTSASTARNFADILGPERLKTVLANSHLKYFSIGPQTTRSMEEVGLPVHAIATPHDIPGLIQAIQQECARNAP
jgi:uroporphyrinogen III methyltransferase/synthase